MGTLAEYFAKNRPTATWQFGDRVCGKFNGVPFVGTCGGEGMVNETEGSLVTVFLDLPLKSKNTWHNTYIKVKPKTLKRLGSSNDPIKKSK
jgi:hypothetical protein